MESRGEGEEEAAQRREGEEKRGGSNPSSQHRIERRRIGRLLGSGGEESPCFCVLEDYGLDIGYYRGSFGKQPK